MKPVYKIKRFVGDKAEAEKDLNKWLCSSFGVYLRAWEVQPMAAATDYPRITLTFHPHDGTETTGIDVTCTLKVVKEDLPLHVCKNDDFPVLSPADPYQTKPVHEFAEQIFRKLNPIIVNESDACIEHFCHDVPIADRAILREGRQPGTLEALIPFDDSGYLCSQFDLRFYLRGAPTPIHIYANSMDVTELQGMIKHLVVVYSEWEWPDHPRQAINPAHPYAARFQEMTSLGVFLPSLTTRCPSRAEINY